jgi:hypothetical protein
MENETGPQDQPKTQPKIQPKIQPKKPQLNGFLRWATTPPQSYVVYLAGLILIWLVSFYAGTLKPKKAQGLGPPPISTPQK